ncbi:hypothetical protein EII19_07470 [Comamonadaceae bacterium OH2310_COT-174]|nr:hypothetical protein EII19_07470 [Comamonadaceae bacterium OH2310_COT-174]
MALKRSPWSGEVCYRFNHRGQYLQPLLHKLVEHTSIQSISPVPIRRSQQLHAPGASASRFSSHQKRVVVTISADIIPSTDTVRGVLLGLALGDTLGAPYEGGLLARGLWALLGRTPEGVRRFTDDTQMSLDLAESLLACGGLNQDDLAQRFARSYQWRRGYGPGAAKVLRRIRAGQPWQQANRSAHPQGSWGNGAAMRAPVLALWPFVTEQALAQAARQSAQVTHAHPQGMAGAVLLALATRALMTPGINADAVLTAARGALSDAEAEAFDPALRTAAAWLAQGDAPTPRQVARMLGHGITARTSCVTALYLALRHLEQPFEALIRFATACRGDTDTIAAMAGALWGARRGAKALPTLRLEQQERLEDVAGRLQRCWLGAAA